MATALFIAFFVLVGLAIFFVAMSGGARGARARLQSQGSTGQRVAPWVFGAIFLAFGVAIPAALLIGNTEHASEQIKGVKLAPVDRTGRELFSQHCATCHTLSAVRAQGKVGPNLDILKPKKALILDALEHGRQRGNGTMPARIVQGHDATAVADFVDKVAGR